MSNNRKDVYTIKKRKDGKGFWFKIGSAFVNDDGVINVILAATPVSGELRSKDPKVKAEQPQAEHPETNQQ